MSVQQNQKQSRERSAVPSQWDAEPFSGINVSEKWKARFLAIEDAGGPSMSNVKNISKDSRKLINRNWPGFFVGPAYLAIKGLWQQAIGWTTILVGILAVTISLRSHIMLGVCLMLFAHFCAFRANVGYYNKLVLGQTSWL